MDGSETGTLVYKRSRFVTRLPLGYFYTPSHYWLDPQNGGWRVGLTSFATRMLGEIVDFGFEVQRESAIRCGQALGWIEGFKAIADVVSLIDGRFCQANPGLDKSPEGIDRDCYGQGWLYEATGDADCGCLDVQGYAAHLNATIDKLREEQSRGSE